MVGCGVVASKLCKAESKDSALVSAAAALRSSDWTVLAMIHAQHEIINGEICNSHCTNAKGYHPLSCPHR